MYGVLTDEQVYWREMAQGKDKDEVSIEVSFSLFVRWNKVHWHHTPHALRYLSLAPPAHIKSIAWSSMNRLGPPTEAMAGKKTFCAQREPRFNLQSTTLEKAFAEGTTPSFTGQ